MPYSGIWICDCTKRQACKITRRLALTWSGVPTQGLLRVRNTSQT